MSGRENSLGLSIFWGGGFQNGDGSEPRYDGENLARRGMVAVTLNYRTNIFGFFSHPELTRESPHRASGNYGLLDQVAALDWVKRNIAAFGGDPKRVTITGESAGSISISVLMASPLSRTLIAGAIGESGAMFSSLPPRPLAESEENGAKFAAAAGSLAALRKMTAEQIQEVMARGKGFRFSTALDGYFLPRRLKEIFQAGEQSKIPLLAGSNSEEAGARAVLGAAEPTIANFSEAVKRLYGERAGIVLKAYAPSRAEEVTAAATDLASDLFIAHSTWKWTELHGKTGGKPVCRYLYAHPRPRFLGNAAGPAPPPAAGPAPGAPRGAAHPAEIQYAMGNPGLDPRYAWGPEDHQVSRILQAYFVNFIRKGNPNGKGLPKWPAYQEKGGYQRMRVDGVSQAGPEPSRQRYLALDQAAEKP